MEGFKVIITTSGLGSRLGNLTDYTNKCLIRVADKPAISYIVESYPKDTEFVITLGHFGNHVKQFLKLAYPNHIFTFVEIDKFQGEGSSLGYSLLKCKKEINCPFIFHASDTIIKNFIIPKLENNWVMGNQKKESSQYRTLNINQSKLVKINEKGELSYDICYVGICGIKDYNLFFKNLEKLINGGHVDTSDVHVINEMLSDVEFYHKEILQENWFDIGNTTELIKTRKKIKSNIEVLDKKDESIFFFDNFIIKFFYDNSINKNRVMRARNLGDLVPEVLDYTENFYKYKKAEGQLFSKSVNFNKFIKFLEWTKMNLWIKKEKIDFDKSCYQFYIEKTLKRINQYLKEMQDVNNINGENIPDIFELINSIDKNWLCRGIPSQYHGDFILDNIIETNDNFKLIDWRQDFAGDLEIGDLYYDLAKLNHNLIINHDIINNSFFNFSNDNCYILINSTLNECREQLERFITENGYDLKKVKVLTSLIWLNMAPLHEYPFNTFLFNYGKYNLYKNLKIRNV